MNNPVFQNGETAQQIRKAFATYLYLLFGFKIRYKNIKMANNLRGIVFEDAFCKHLYHWFKDNFFPCDSFGEFFFVAARDSGLFAQETASLKGEEARAFAVSACDDAQHNFVLGLATLRGVEVLQNPMKGLALITNAAQAGNAPAAKYLYNYYLERKNGAFRSPEKALYWAKKLYQRYLAAYGETDARTLSALLQASHAAYHAGDTKDAVLLAEQYYQHHCAILGETHERTISACETLMTIYLRAGEERKMLNMAQQCYQHCRSTLAETDRPTLTALSLLAGAYSQLGDHKKALPLSRRAYRLNGMAYGEEDRHTLEALHDYANECVFAGDHQTAWQLRQKAYEMSVKIYGKDSRKTMCALCVLAKFHEQMGDEAQAEQAYEAFVNDYVSVLDKDDYLLCQAVEWLEGAYRKRGDTAKLFALRRLLSEVPESAQ